MRYEKTPNEVYFYERFFKNKGKIRDKSPKAASFFGYDNERF